MVSRLKKISIFALLILAILVGTLIVYARSYYIVIPQGKLRIPPSIVLRKDCSQYSKFIESLAQPGFIPDTNCPWAKVGAVGVFTLGEVQMRVPREYIWFDRNMQDGNARGLNLMFKYPEMSPGNPHDGDQNSNISVLILDYPKNKGICTRSGCVSHPVGIYRQQTIDFFDPKNSSSPLEHISYDSLLKLNTYQSIWRTNQGKVSSIHDIFYRGDVRTPTYWLICEEKFEGGFNVNPRCETHLYVTKLLLANIGYPRTLLPSHDDIHNKLLQKLNSFVVKSDSIKRDAHAN